MNKGIALFYNVFRKRNTKWGILLSLYIITYFANLKGKHFLIGPKYRPNPVSLVSMYDLVQGLNVDYVPANGVRNGLRFTFTELTTTFHSRRQFVVIFIKRCYSTQN